MKLWYRASAESENTFTPDAGASNPITMHQDLWFEFEAKNLVDAVNKAEEILESFDGDFSLIEVTLLDDKSDVEEE